MRVLFLASLVFLSVISASILEASTDQWAITIKSDNGSGSYSSSTTVGVISAADDGYDSKDALYTTSPTLRVQCTSQVGTYNLIKDIRAPFTSGSKKWTLKLFNNNCTTSSTRLRLYMVSSFLPPAGQYTLKMVDNGGKTDAPYVGYTWQFAMPSSYTSDPLISITLPGLTSSESGYILELETSLNSGIVFTPDGGTYYSSQQVYISDNDPDSYYITYTTDGSEPTYYGNYISSGGSITVDKSMTLRASSWAQPYYPEYALLHTKTASYTIIQSPDPEISPAGGTYNAGFDATITCSDPDAIIRYTTNGQAPTETSSQITSGASVPITQNTVLKARTWKTGFNPGNIITADYKVQAATPTFSPDTGQISSPTAVCISCLTPGSEIHYTTNGVDPTTSDPSITSGDSIQISRGTVLKARAFKTNWTDSAVKSADYVMLGHNNTYYVGTDGNDTNDGFTWATAKKKIQSAIDGAVSGDQVFVKAGTYTDYVTAKSGIALYGGFAGMEAALSERVISVAKDAGVNATIMDANQTYFTINFPSNCDQTTRLDGFTITNEGIRCSGSPVIINNRIINNNGSGIYASSGSPLIERNWIQGNGSTYCGDGGGIYCDYCNPVIVNNVITGNTAVCAFMSYIGYNGGLGSAIYCNECNPTILNNTIVGNTCVYDSSYNPNGGSVHLAYCGNITLQNNIIASSSSGIRIISPGEYISGANDIFSNTDFDYSVPESYNTAADISSDPVFADAASYDFHLASGSPCKNAGVVASYIPSLDIDGSRRICGAAIDIGAYESILDIASAKTAFDGDTVEISNAVITAAYSGYFYIESIGRAHGIRVEKSDFSASQDKLVTVCGRTATNSDGERYIAATSAVIGTEYNAFPLFMTVKAIGGSVFGIPPAGQAGVKNGTGLNNIGLLVKICGKATYLNSTAFSVNDGSEQSVECRIVDGSVDESISGKSVIVTGVCSCVKTDNVLKPVILLRNTNAVTSVDNRADG